MFQAVVTRHQPARGGHGIDPDDQYGVGVIGLQDPRGAADGSAEG